jgi:hypothetical protein
VRGSIVIGVTVFFSYDLNSFNRCFYLCNLVIKKKEIKFGPSGDNLKPWKENLNILVYNKWFSKVKYLVRIKLILPTNYNVLNFTIKKQSMYQIRN